MPEADYLGLDRARGDWASGSAVVLDNGISGRVRIFVILVLSYRVARASLQSSVVEAAHSRAALTGCLCEGRDGVLQLLGLG